MLCVEKHIDKKLGRLKTIKAANLETFNQLNKNNDLIGLSYVIFIRSFLIITNNPRKWFSSVNVKIYKCRITLCIKLLILQTIKI